MSVRPFAPLTITIARMWERVSYLRPGEWRQDLERLHARGLSDAAVARELSRMYPGQTFTRYQIWYYLHEDDRLSQVGECVPLRGNDLHHRRAVHQMLSGFGHLLPLPLRHRESDILALLRDKGPMTRPEIARALGIKTLRTRHQHWLARLFRLGLICVAGTVHARRRPLHRYAIAPSVVQASGVA